MAEVTLLIGPPQTMTENVVYRLPSRRTTLFATAATTVANDPAFTLNATLAGSTSHVCAAQYIKCATSTQIRLRG